MEESLSLLKTQQSLFLHPLPHDFDPLLPSSFCRNNDTNIDNVKTSLSNNNNNDNDNVDYNCLNMHQIITNHNTNCKECIINIDKKQCSIGRMEFIQSIVKHCKDTREYRSVDVNNNNNKVHTTKHNQTTHSHNDCNECQFWCRLGAKYLSKEMIVSSLPQHYPKKQEEYNQLYVHKKFCKLLLLNGKYLSSSSCIASSSSSSSAAASESSKYTMFQLQHGDVLSILLPSNNEYSTQHHYSHNIPIKSQPPPSFHQISFVVISTHQPEEESKIGFFASLRKKRKLEKRGIVSNDIHKIQSTCVQQQHNNNNNVERDSFILCGQNSSSIRESYSEDSPMLDMHHFSMIENSSSYEDNQNEIIIYPHDEITSSPMNEKSINHKKNDIILLSTLSLSELKSIRANIALEMKNGKDEFILSKYRLKHAILSIAIAKKEEENDAFPHLLSKTIISKSEVDNNI